MQSIDSQKISTINNIKRFFQNITLIQKVNFTSQAQCP